MSTTTSDTSAIDEKKNNSVSDININGQTIKEYVQTIVPSILKAFIYFLLGSMVLYGTLSAQAGLFPANMDYYPYTEKVPTMQKVVSNIYETDDGKFSQKIFFDYESNRKGNSILDFLRSHKKKDASVVSVFFINIIQSIIRLNYSSLSEIFNSIREFEINDFYIVLFGPIVLIFFAIIFLMFVNPIYFIYLWFMNLGLFVQKDILNPQSESYGMESMQFWIGVCLIFLFVFLFFVLFGFFGSIISIISIFTVMFAIFRYKCNLNGKDNIGFGTILSNNIKYYKDILAILISIPLVTNANTIFGSLGVGIIILILIATYFGLTIDFYKPSELDKLSKSIPEKRAEIIPDNNSINNIINNVADKAKQAVEVGKKALAQGKEKATESFNKFTSGIASKIPAAPIVQIPTTPMVTPMVTPMTQGNIIKGNDNLTK
jgi:hypothetical protein